MKLALCVLFCLEAALTATPSRADLEDWEAWKEEHGKSYPTNSEARDELGELIEDEESFRRKVWLENKAAIEEHNRQFNEGLHTFHLALNEFSDLLGPEFVSIMNGFRPLAEGKVNGSDSHFLPDNFDSLFLPEKVDWREKGAVTGVKNQGNCGSCWAFSATGALEAAHHKKTGQLVSLSEQQLVDCSKNDNLGCDGGFHNKAFEYIKNNGGLDTEESYPYEGRDGKCRFKASDIGATDVGIRQIKDGDENALKHAVATVGPVSVAIDAEYLQHYGGGVYSEPGCKNEYEDLNHGVLAVGYGTEGGKDYWLIKNSWGSDWGEKGYFKLARNEDNMCGVVSDASYPLV